MDNSSTGLVTAAKAGVKQGLTVHLAASEQQNMLSQLVNFKGQSQKGNQSSTRVVHVTTNKLNMQKENGFN